MYIVTYCEDNRVHVPDVFDSLQDAWNCMARHILRESRHSQVLTKKDARQKLIEIVTTKDIQTKEKILTSLPHVTYYNFLELDPEFIVELPEYTFTIQLFTCYDNYKLIPKGDNDV